MTLIALVGIILAGVILVIFAFYATHIHKSRIIRNRLLVTKQTKRRKHTAQELAVKEHTAQELAVQEHTAQELAVQAHTFQEPIAPYHEIVIALPTVEDAQTFLCAAKNHLSQINLIVTRVLETQPTEADIDNVVKISAEALPKARNVAETATEQEGFARESLKAAYTAKNVAQNATIQDGKADEASSDQKEELEIQATIELVEQAQKALYANYEAKIQKLKAEQLRNEVKNVKQTSFRFTQKLQRAQDQLSPEVDAINTAVTHVLEITKVIPTDPKAIEIETAAKDLAEQGHKTMGDFDRVFRAQKDRQARVDQDYNNIEAYFQTTVKAMSSTRETLRKLDRMAKEIFFIQPKNANIDQPSLLAILEANKKKALVAKERLENLHSHKYDPLKSSLESKKNEMIQVQGDLSKAKVDKSRFEPGSNEEGHANEKVIQLETKRGTITEELNKLQREYDYAYKPVLYLESKIQEWTSKIAELNNACVKNVCDQRRVHLGPQDDDDKYEPSPMSE